MSALLGAAAESRCLSGQAACKSRRSVAVTARLPQRQGPARARSHSGDRQPLVIRAGQQPLMPPR
jgi:hypothetical protein